MVDGFDSQGRIKHLDIMKTLGFIKQLVHDGNCLRDSQTCLFAWLLELAKSKADFHGCLASKVAFFMRCAHCPAAQSRGSHLRASGMIQD